MESWLKANGHDLAKHVGLQKFIALDASNMTDKQNPKDGTKACCWFQFFYLTAYVTGTNIKGDEFKRYIDPTKTPKGTPVSPWPDRLDEQVTVDPTNPSWDLDRVPGGPANYDATGESIREHDDASGEGHLEIFDAPQLTSAECALELAEWLQNAADKGQESFGFKTVTSVELTMHTQDFLMCGGKSVAKVDWNAYVNFNFSLYRAEYNKRPHSGEQSVTATALKSACTVLPTYVAPAGSAIVVTEGAPSEAQMDLVKFLGKDYPGKGQ